MCIWFRKHNLTPKTSIQIVADEETQKRYTQLDAAKVEKLFIKFTKKEGIYMPKYEIVSDVNNEIVYNEIHEGTINREQVANARALIEEKKNQKAGLEAEIAELEKFVEEAEHIIELADKKKEAEAEATVVEEATIVENVTE